MDLIGTGITVERGGRLALAAPDFRVNAGQAARLTGPNGAGKSTLLRALAGLLPIASGDARFGDASLSDDREAMSQICAYAGHSDAVKPAMSVAENLESWARLYSGSADRGRVADALARFGVDHIADAPASYCSAGQKRRLGLARLLVTGRPLWLLDEPTVSLDAASVSVFAGLVAEHCAKGGVAIAATHIEIGLPDGPEITLAPPEREAVEAGDAFLSGDWS